MIIERYAYRTTKARMLFPGYHVVRAACEELHRPGEAIITIPGFSCGDLEWDGQNFHACRDNHWNRDTEGEMPRSRDGYNDEKRIDHAIAHSLFRDDATIEPFRTTGVADHFEEALATGTQRRIAFHAVSFFGHPACFWSAPT
jgi:hypothetical protein